MVHPATGTTSEQLLGTDNVKKGVEDPGATGTRWAGPIDPSTNHVTDGSEPEGSLSLIVAFLKPSVHCHTQYGCITEKWEIYAQERLQIEVLHQLRSATACTEWSSRKESLISCPPELQTEIHTCYGKKDSELLVPGSWGGYRVHRFQQGIEKKANLSLAL